MAARVDRGYQVRASGVHRLAACTAPAAGLWLCLAVLAESGQDVRVLLAGAGPQQRLERSAGPGEPDALGACPVCPDEVWGVVVFIHLTIVPVSHGNHSTPGGGPELKRALQFVVVFLLT